jgi:hypothetical protein
LIKLVAEETEGGGSVHRESSILIRILNWVLVAAAVAGFAGALLTGCDRTISDDERRPNDQSSEF